MRLLDRFALALRKRDPERGSTGTRNGTSFALAAEINGAVNRGDPAANPFGSNPEKRQVHL